MRNLWSRSSNISPLDLLTNEDGKIESWDSELCAEEIAARAMRPKASQVAFRAQSLFLSSIFWNGQLNSGSV